MPFVSEEDYKLLRRAKLFDEQERERFRVKTQCDTCGYQSMDIRPESNTMCPMDRCHGGMEAFERKHPRAAETRKSEEATSMTEDERPRGKIRIWRGTFLHLGTPWKGGVLAFENPKASDWRVRRLYGIASNSFGFLGLMLLDRN